MQSWVIAVAYSSWLTLVSTTVAPRQSSQTTCGASSDERGHQTTAVHTHHITLDGGVDDLRQHILVGEANHQSVFGGVVLILVLANQPLPRTVVGLTLAPATELDLVTLEIRLCLLHLDERLRNRKYMQAERRNSQQLIPVSMQFVQAWSTMHSIGHAGYE